jgi:hypothetical protein
MSRTFEVVPEWVHVTHVESAEFREVYGFAGGGQGTVNLEGIRLLPKDRPSKTLVVYMHPASTLQLLPLPRAMVERGVHVRAPAAATRATIHRSSWRRWRSTLAPISGGRKRRGATSGL